MHAVRKFLIWVEERDLELPRVSPGDVGEYLEGLELATPSKKLHLAGLRRFFDRLVNRHVTVINPAATFKAERYTVVEGKTPEIGADQARTLLKSIDEAASEGRGSSGPVLAALVPGGDGDGPAGAQGLLQLLLRPEDQPRLHRDDPPVLAMLVHRRIDHGYPC